VVFFFSSRRRHTRWPRDWSSDVCSSDLTPIPEEIARFLGPRRPVSGVREIGRSPPESVWLGPGDRCTRRRCPPPPPWHHPRPAEIGRASCRERGNIPEERLVVKKNTTGA